MSVVVLALDAADLHHAESFGCEHILLDNHTGMTSLAHTFDYPHTGEVWPSIATGLHPAEHGVTGQGEWDSAILTQLSRVAHRLAVSGEVRKQIGGLINEYSGQQWQLNLVDEPTFLDGEHRAVHNWPGVHRNDVLQYLWQLFQQAKDDKLSTETFRREAYTEAASKFGWLKAAMDYDIEVAAVHIHLLDVLGHLYPNDRERYREVYDAVDAMVAEIRNLLGEDDELLILSDHGIETAWVEDDDTPGRHSWRAMASSTVDTPPEHVLDVRAWVEEHVTPAKQSGSRIDIPEDQLRELGYIE
jgi:hypothetical protein